MENNNSAEQAEWGETRGSGATPDRREYRESDGYKKGTNTNDICVPKRNPLLYVNLLFYPKNLDLKAMLANVEGGEFWLNDKYLQGLYFVISYIMYQYTFKGLGRGHFVNMGSEFLKMRMGKVPGGNYVYKQGITLLEKLGVIRVNPPYSVGKFCKSYALEKEYRGPEYEKISFAGKPLLDAPFQPENPVAGFLASNLCLLGLDEERLKEIMALPEISNDKERSLRIEHSAQRIRNRDFRVKTGKSQGRFYHVLNECPRELRQAVTLEGKALLETDVPTCQPILLLSILNDAIPLEESEDYRKTLQKDVYAELGDGRREHHKKEFLCFAFPHYAKEGITSWEQFVERNAGNVLGANFIKRFPHIARGILSHDGSLAGHLQNLEAEICLYGVMAELMRRKIFAVSIHDGFLIRPDDYEEVADLVWCEFAERFGIYVKLKKKGA